MPWTLESCAAFLSGRRKRAKHEAEEQVEQATAAPGEKRDLPKREVPKRNLPKRRRRG